jgi:hypothetical protein
MDLARALPLRKQKISPLGQLLVDKKLVNEEYGIQFASEKIRNLSLHSDPTSISEIKNDSFATLLAKYTYYDLASSEEELSMLFKNIKSYLSVEAVSPSLSEIGIEIDGSPKPLTWYQMLRFGNHKKRLRAKILYARQLSSQIIQDVLNLTENNDEKKNYLDDIGADTRLLHNFILEQISPLKRFAISSKVTYTSFFFSILALSSSDFLELNNIESSTFAKSFKKFALKLGFPKKTIVRCGSF